MTVTSDPAGSGVALGSPSSDCATLIPIPQTTSPSDPSNRTPATLRLPSRTSFGHLIPAASRLSSTDSATARPATSESSGCAVPPGGLRSTERSSDCPATSSHLPAQAAAAACLVLGDRDGTLGQVGAAERILRRGARLAPEVGPAETAAKQPLDDVSGEELGLIQHKECCATVG